MISKKKLNSAAIRRANTARVFHAIRQQPGLSPRGLGQLTGIDGATLSIILGQLEQDGLLIRDTAAATGHSGRPKSLLSIDAKARLMAGVALEVDEIQILIAGLTGARLAVLSVPGCPTPEGAAGAIKAGILALLKQLGLARKSLACIGVGVPGLVGADGRLVLAPALAWRDVDFAGLLSAALGVPAYLENDTNVAAAAEHLFGGSQNVANFVYISGNSGLGGGLYLGGGIYRGPRGLAGELGHMKLVPNGRLCACGGHGCLQTYVSGHAILQRVAESGSPAADMSVVRARALAGDDKLRAILAEAGEALGLGLASLANLLAPERIVLGGSLAGLAAFLLPSCRQVFNANAMPGIAGDVAITVSELDAFAIPMGGVALALQRLFDDPGFF